MAAMVFRRCWDGLALRGARRLAMVDRQMLRGHSLRWQPVCGKSHH
jgi:hypothetical protein